MQAVLNALRGGTVEPSKAASVDDMPSAGFTPAPGHEACTFGGGCFWRAAGWFNCIPLLTRGRRSVQLVFDRQPGVVKTLVGYSQGHTSHPTYKQVCTGATGHSEVVLVEYDPKVVPFDRLVTVLFNKINPLQFEGQGNDVGSQYRTGVYFHTAAQREVALAHKAAVAARLGKPVAPEVLPATRFWEAEAVHQKYLEKGTGGRAQSAAKLCSDPVRCYG